MKTVYEIVYDAQVIAIVESEEAAKSFCDKMNAAFKLDLRRRYDMYCYIEHQLDKEPKTIISFVVGFKGSLIDPCIQTFDDKRFHLGEITVLWDGTINVCFSLLSDDDLSKENVIKKAKDVLFNKK